MPCASWTRRAARMLFVAPEGVLQRVVTDGDVRRYILRGGALTGPVRDMANYQPKRAAHGGAGAGARPLLLEHGHRRAAAAGQAGQGRRTWCLRAGLDIDTHKKA